MNPELLQKGQILNAFRTSGEFLGELIGELIWEAMNSKKQPADDTPLLPNLMTRKEAAESLRISKSYLDILVRTRGLPVIRTGIRQIRFSRSDVEAWVKNELPHLLERPAPTTAPSTQRRRKSRRAR